MSDDNELSEVERAAEAILREASSMYDLNGEPCPEGDACAIHHRNDEEVLVDEEEFGRIITYTGEFCVITSDNPDLDNPVVLMKLLLGMYKDDELPEKFETCILHVGEGSVSDLRKLDEAGRKKSIRFIQQHSDWSNFKGAHEAVLSSLKDGLIDVSKPVKE